MKRTINRNMLKYAAGRAITCSGCDQIMDWTRTAIVTVERDGNPVSSKAICVSCFDRGIGPAREALATSDQQGRYKIDVLDGRTV